MNEESKPKRPPTPKQARFASEYVATGNASEAYRRAYDTGSMLPATIQREASLLMDNPIVSALIQEEQALALAPARLTAQDVLSRAWEIAQSDAKDRVPALNVAARAFPEFRDVTIDQSQHVHLPDNLTLDELRKLANGL